MIFAVDAGSQLVGYAGMDSTGKLLTSGQLKIPRGMAHDEFLERIKYLSNELCDIVRDWPCDILATELPHANPKNIKSSIMVAITTGYFISTVLQLRPACKVVMIPPAHIKSLVTGSGNASKELVRSCVKLRYPEFKDKALPYDEADAIAIAITCLTENVLL